MVVITGSHRQIENTRLACDEQQEQACRLEGIDRIFWQDE